VTTVDDVAGVTRNLFACGVTTYCPTIVTGSFARINLALQAIATACRKDSLVSEAIAGIHVEGPYISAEDGPRGAHDRSYIRDPNVAEFADWQRSAEGKIAMITLAPEREGAVGFIRQLVSDGVKVSIGHTMANTEQLKQASAFGASLSTHLGNGAHPVLPRHPNYIWDQLADERLYMMLIADGHHLPASVLKAMIRAKRDLFIIVSDCVKFGGMPPGRYSSHIGDEVELLDNGRLQTTANPYILAGSAQSLDRGVENAMRLAGVHLREAVDAVTKRPAEAMGWTGLGRMEAGYQANLTLFRLDSDGAVQVQETVLGGRSVWQRG
jgi:N-acetylglucosamine-6-phosphate deacetylase